MTGADLLLECLRRQGVDRLFGMPGTQNLPIYDALAKARNDLRHILIRHEQTAALAANGYARATGRVGVALTVPGPGVGNASAGLGDAMTDRVPVLLIAGGYARDLAARDRSKLFHGLDQRQFLQPITRYYGCPQTPDEIPGIVEHAFHAMLDGRPGPAAIEIGPDVAATSCAEGSRPCDAVQPATYPAADSALLAQAGETLAKLHRPIVLLGADVATTRTSELVLEVAERLTAPLVFTRLAKGVIPDRNPLVVGTCRSTSAQKLLREADGLLAVGTRFTQIDTLAWSDRLPPTVVQLDRDPLELGREYPVTLGIPGDLHANLTGLLTVLSGCEIATSRAWAERVAEVRHEMLSRPPVPVLSEIREALPEDGILSVDVTTLGYRAFDEFDVADQRQYLYPCHYLTLGFGFPAALGAKAAWPEKPVVALCGDAGFLMTCMDLATAVEERLGVVSVVVTDRCLTAIRGSQLRYYAGRTIATDMHVPNFAALAQAFGARGQTCRDLSALPQLIRDALAEPLPTVIEVAMAERVAELIDSIPWLLEK